MLPVIAPGTWLHADGARIRALRYSAVRSAAATLVPAGCWIDVDERGVVIITGEHGEWIGGHPVPPIALCIAALNARIAEVHQGG